MRPRVCTLANIRIIEILCALSHRRHLVSRFNLEALTVYFCLRCFLQRAGERLRGFLNGFLKWLAADKAGMGSRIKEDFFHMDQTIRILQKWQHTPVGLATVTVGLLMLVACAADPLPPNETLQAADQAIATAEQARVADYASQELSEAREKLAAAHEAVQQGNMVLAQRLAEQSRVNAELALARASVVKAKKVNDETQKSIDVMKQEMQRNMGTRP